MKVRLMLTCLCDAFAGEVGIATVRVLEHLGCEVAFEPNQTCCGQPPFNSGDWKAAREIAQHCRSVLLPETDDVPLVAPSGSCTAMVREGYAQLFGQHGPARAFELGEFIVRVLGVTTWPASKPYPRKVALHPGCHGRSLGLRDEHRQLLTSIPGLELVEFLQPEQCCGFGGAFAATHGKLSQGIGKEKLLNVLAAQPEELVGTDMGCLLHLKGLQDRDGGTLRIRHFAEVLAETLP